MNWIHQGSGYLCPPYQLFGNVRGYEVWIHDEERYQVLARELPTLAKAKEFCETHAKETA